MNVQPPPPKKNKQTKKQNKTKQNKTNKTKQKQKQKKKKPKKNQPGALNERTFLQPAKNKTKILECSSPATACPLWTSRSGVSGNLWS